VTIEYVEGIPERRAYLELFQTTGWNELYHVGARELEAGLKKSWYCLSAYEGAQLVGFGRLLSDGILYAVIFDMIVATRYQGRGIGSKILRLLLEKCNQAGIRDILLFSAKQKAGFYRKFGFVPRPEDAPGMILRCALKGS
jgi:ribosomal protein S18 acetylase RimI-like enzyme